MEIVNSLITVENPAATGVITANGLLMFWEESAPSGWIGKICGITNPVKIMGVAVANISNVMGVS